VIDPEKLHLGPQNSPGCLGTEKLAKNSKLLEDYFELVGIGGWPPISTWINPTSLGSNGIQCVEFLGEREKHLLNLHIDELLALLEKL
jgi:hypothetical protein